MNKSKENTGELSPNNQPLFRTVNYILVAVGIVFLVLGYFLLSGGGSNDPEVFNSDIYNTRRLVVAPMLMLIGLIIPIAAIMYRSKK